MAKNECCPKCGVALPSNAPAGICPKCLMQAAIDPSVTDAPDDAAAHVRGPNPIRLADAATLPPSDVEVARSGSTGVGPGTRVRYFGEYELLEEIARGGMGVVYKARQRTLKRIVALKMILSGQLAGPEEVRRFQVEAEAAAKLNHPNIVPIFEIGQYEGQHYFSMAFVDGESLAHKLVAGPMLPRPAVELMKKVADAVAFAHLEGVVHRDLKPANVLIDKDGEPRITDFGLAKRISTDSLQDSAQESAASLTATGDVLGTPNYMSPEQAGGENEKIGPLSDVYSLGAILYCLLTGRPPFQGASPIETLIQVLQLEPVSPRLLNPKVPRDLQTIALKCLEKQPERRYASAQQLANELGRFSRGEPITARPTGSIERGWRWCRRKPALASMIVALLAVLFAGLFGITTQWIRAEQERDRAEINAGLQTQARHDADEARDQAEIKAKEAKLAAASEQQARITAEAAESHTRQILYGARMNLVQQAWQENRVQRVRELLDACRPRDDKEDPRGFEWYYFWQLCHSERFTLRPHPSNVHAAVFSPDGKLLATAGDRNKGTLLGLIPKYVGDVKLWDVASRQELATLKGHEATITAIAFSPDGKLLASAGGGNDEEGRDYTIRIWDVATKSTIHILGKNQGPVTSVRFSPDGRVLAAGVAERNINAKLWDVATGAELRQFGGGVGGGYQASVAFSFDGDSLATAVSSGDSVASVKIWDVGTGQEQVKLVRQNGLANSVALSPRRPLLATGNNDGTIQFWSTKTGEQQAAVNAHPNGVADLAFSPDGKTLASSGRDGTVKLWNSEFFENKAVELLESIRGHTDWVFSVAFSPDGTMLTTTSNDRTVKLWDLKSRQEADHLIGKTGIVGSLAFVRDGQALVTAAGIGTVKLWDLATRQEQRTLFQSPFDLESTDRLPLAVSSDGKTLAIGVRDNNVARGSGPNIKLFDIASGQEQRTIEQKAGSVLSLAFSKDRQTLAVLTGQVGLLGLSRVVKVWDTSTTSDPIVVPGMSGCAILSYSPDGKFLTLGNQNGSVDLLDAATWKVHGKFQAHSGCVMALAFAPDGQTVATAGTDRSTVGKPNVIVKVWDFSTFNQRAILPGHADEVTSLAFAPNGKTLASASKDATVILWQIPTGQQLIKLEDHMRGEYGGTEWVQSVMFAPDGQTLAMAKANGLVTLWRAANEGQVRAMSQ